jgi:Tfp pilus assembly protein FimT
MNFFRPVKKASGVTLTELLIIVSIVGILAVALGFSFQGWMGNYKIESELKQMYADIMDVRTRAMTQNRVHSIVISAGNYAVYEDANDDNTAELLLKTTPLPYNAGWTGTITFNTRGLTASSAAISIPISLPSGASPDFDCILVYQSRVAMGKMSGGVCVYK